MKNVYPVILTPGQTFVVAHIPDFNISTQGTDMADAMEMARDAIGLVGIDLEDDGEPIPAASALATVQGTTANDIVTLIDVDFAEYRRKNDLRTVKKNCTIPSWLNFEAEKAGINFSAVLQQALKQELHLTNR